MSTPILPRTSTPRPALTGRLRAVQFDAALEAMAGDLDALSLATTVESAADWIDAAGGLVRHLAAGGDLSRVLRREAMELVERLEGPAR